MGRGMKNENKQCTPQKKTENVLWSYGLESWEQVLNSAAAAAADCHDHISCSLLLTQLNFLSLHQSLG